MLKGQPKGLIAASIANMGERFGFYTMMAILTLFISDKFGMSGTEAGTIYSVFYFSIYAFAFLGGIIADKTRKYKGTITCGLILMSLGYLLLAIPTTVTADNRTMMLVLTCFCLFIIAFGNGLFKGNLQALVGQMYDNPTYSAKRDSGFSLFYMFINVGAIFAPFIAPYVRNWWLGLNGFDYNGTLPGLCHQYLSGSMTEQATSRFEELATTVSNGTLPSNLTEFATQYIDVFTTGFHYSFAVAILAMLISLTVFLINKKGFPDPANKKAATSSAVEEEKMPAHEVRQRIYALLAVFGVVIFFWFSFHQNGLTLTYFARDYVFLELFSFKLTPEMFQSSNPFFVVFLTPLIVWLYSYLGSKGKEPSTPGKIAIGMGIAALAYVLMTIASLSLPSFATITESGGLAETAKVTPFLLIGTYFILTVAELFISPLGISFVSKVAPPHLQGIMQGAWLFATGLGNLLLFIGAIFYEQLSLSATWGLFVAACLISMFTMLFMLKWLEKISK